jgi:hypothetical protein
MKSCGLIVNVLLLAGLDTRKLLEESLVFDHRPAGRVIFISTPHRGSKLASGWIGRIGAALVRTKPLWMLRRITAAHKREHESDAARPFRRCKIRGRTRVVHRHRGLLEVAQA